MLPHVEKSCQRSDQGMLGALILTVAEFQVTMTSGKKILVCIYNYYMDKPQVDLGLTPPSLPNTSRNTCIDRNKLTLVISVFYRIVKRATVYTEIFKLGKSWLSEILIIFAVIVTQLFPNCSFENAPIFKIL